MALIVCDSTPLIYLARLRRFDLLPRLQNPVMILYRAALHAADE